MKKIGKIFGYIFLGIILLITLLLIYVKTMLPSVGNAPDTKVEMSPANIERGKYLANHVSVCIDCHSTRDWSLFAGPPIAGTEGKGGEVFDQKMGFPGKYVAPNITPFHLKDWKDGEIFRAITSGVSKNGNALFPIMPHHLYGQLDKKDIEAIIAYLRSLTPIENKTEASHSDFPMNFIINTIPKKPSFVTMPSPDDKINYGKYLVTAAACVDCHTKQEQGKFVGEQYAGGFEFKMPDGSIVTSANLTPDKETGIGNLTSDEFVNLFKKFDDSTYVRKEVKPGEFQTTMPWTMYAGMKKSDLEAIYAYLHSSKPCKNEVVKYTPPK